MTVCRDLERDLRDHRSPHPLFMRKLRSEGEVTRSSLAERALLRNDSKTEAGKCTQTLSHAHSVSFSHTHTNTLTRSHMYMLTNPWSFCPQWILPGWHSWEKRRELFFLYLFYFMLFILSPHIVAFGGRWKHLRCTLSKFQVYTISCCHHAVH